MSINDLKGRLRDVPGIENLTMRLEGGQQVFSVGGAFATVHPLAMDHEIDAAIRSVAPAALPTATQFNPPPAPTVNAVAPSSSLIPAVTMAPAINEGKKPMSTGTASPVAGAMAVKDMLGEHVRLMAEIQAAQVELLRSTLAQQRNSVSAAVGSVARTIAAQTDEFNAIMGQFTNSVGVE